MADQTVHCANLICIEEKKTNGIERGLRFNQGTFAYAVDIGNGLPEPVTDADAFLRSDHRVTSIAFVSQAIVEGMAVVLNAPMRWIVQYGTQVPFSENR